ncbi:peroxisomal leader peptide-processing protease isoform X2 [Harpegnathos saltator]|uniref:peroxisomal leader peptide-processing protease isoform X2 n=1 Tax=Harpegnathos saltator TaxID=610380 RepID=UPI00058D9F20|nr:peroxisomal leader peptide-processing protease isoform X2 [Harpegnathos saltator]
MRDSLTDAWTGSALVLHTSSEYSASCPKSSAISISRDWVLTHGTVLEPVIRTSDAISRFVEGIVPGQLTSVPEELAGQFEFLVLRQQNGDVKQHRGKLVFAWICPLLRQTFHMFFNTWSFHQRELLQSRKPQRQLFLLIRVDSDQPLADVPTAKRALRYLQLQVSSRAFSRGATVEIVSSPFGNVWLIDSVARGVVSNVVGGIIMTDAYVFPKSEGGPVYVVSPDSGSRTLIGMVIVTMVWCRDEWVHYTFAANLAPCLSAILPNYRSLSPAKLPILHDKANASDRGVVMVTCGSSKGTGILVDKDAGIFVTCSHVIEEAKKEIAIIVFKEGQYSRVPTKLLFNNPKALPYDVAVLKVDPSELDPSLEPVQLSDAPIAQGEPVIAVGFAFFLSTRPTVSSGVVAKSLDCMLITTCCIQGGFSGGPIISRTTGKMLGMIACNVQSCDNSVHFQRMSLSVPAAVLSKPLRQYLLTDNTDALQPLVSNDLIVRKTWALEYHSKL